MSDLENAIVRLTEHFIKRVVPQPPAVVPRHFWEGHFREAELTAVGRDVQLLIDTLHSVSAHGCLTGDCPHDTQTACNASLADAFRELATEGQ